MRRKDLELTGKENIEPIIKRCKSLRLGMIADGEPYVIPMVYGYSWDDKLLFYMHCGLTGRKNQALKEGARVAFEIDIDEGLMGKGNMAKTYTRAFSAVMGSGTLYFAKSIEEKKQFMDKMMLHQTGKSGFEIPASYLAMTNFFILMVDDDTISASRKELVPSMHIEE